VTYTKPLQTHRYNTNIQKTKDKTKPSKNNESNKIHKKKKKTISQHFITLQYTPASAPTYSTTTYSLNDDDDDGGGGGGGGGGGSDGDNNSINKFSSLLLKSYINSVKDNKKTGTK
jgi:hypothetical protein